MNSKEMSDFLGSPVVLVSATGIVMLLLGIVIVLVLASVGRGSLVDLSSITSLAGTGEFTIFYLMAQFVERITEPFTGIHFFGDPNDGSQQQQFARALSIWGLASFFGIILCYLTVGLFQISGIKFTNVGWDINPILAGHTVDSIISGIIVGGGTKPLHDLISYLQGKTPPAPAT